MASRCDKGQGKEFLPWWIYSATGNSFFGLKTYMAPEKRGSTPAGREGELGQIPLPPGSPAPYKRSAVEPGSSSR